MLLSIITINRNNAVGLKATIDSVFAQSIQDFEYIIIDGASSDNSVNLIRDAETKRQIKWVSEPDGGIYNAMNKGARMASGDYMLFLNSGDTFASETVVSEIKSAGINADIVIGRINFIDAEGRIHKDYQNISARHSLYGFRQSLIPHQATLIKRSTFLSLGFYEERYRIVADWQYCLKAIFVHGCNYSTIPVTIADFDNNGVSSTNGVAMMAEIETAFKEIIPASIAEDYLWAERHTSGISMLEWLDRHKMTKIIVNAIISIGRLFSK